MYIFLATNAQPTSEEYCQSDEGRRDDKCASEPSQPSHWTEPEPEPEADQNLESYQSMFDEQGKFKHSLFNQELPKDEFDIFEETDKDTDVEEEDIVEYNHIRTPLYTIRLSSAYEDNITGVHGLNKVQQKWAMDEFVAGRMAPGEMGNGIVLEDVEFTEKLKITDQYYDHAFQQYISDMISLNRSLPDR